MLDLICISLHKIAHLALLSVRIFQLQSLKWRHDDTETLLDFICIIFLLVFTSQNLYLLGLIDFLKIEKNVHDHFTACTQLTSCQVSHT